MKTADFSYDLPPELIAQTPVEPRDAARLLVADRAGGQFSHWRFRDLPRFLQPGDLLICNESRVIPARLFARKPTGGRVEVLLLRPRSPSVWQVLVRGRGIRPGMHLALLDGPDGETIQALARVIEEGAEGLRVMEFDRPALEVAELAGQPPLPPYIHVPLHDPERYQTVYARTPGSVAAPTAGLHLTPDLLLLLREMGVQLAFVTLHVGLGTFRPVEVERIEDHPMHSEVCLLSPQVAAQVNQTKLAGRRVIAVGTTSVRVLETAALRAATGDTDRQGCPWQAVSAFEGETDLFIYPGFRYRVVDGMITNFHLPRSSLLMLVAAFTGKDLVDRAYAEAIRLRYRFYSLGDAMLIL